MKVLLTGATGLTGSFVLPLLLEKKYTTGILVRKESDKKLISGLVSQCQVEEGDILDELLLEKIFTGYDAVIHCAGLVSFNPDRNKEIFEINVLGTTNVVNACLKSKVRKLIHVSSIAALGRTELATAYNEDSKWEDSSINSFYARSKYLAELEVFRGGEEGLDFSIVNPSVIIGPGDVSRSSTRIFSFIRKNNFAYPEGQLNVVDVRDVARVICHLLEINHKKRLVLNAGSITYAQLFQISSAEYGISAPSFKIPRWLIHTGAFADRFVKLFKGGEPFITKENLRFLGKHFTYSSLYYSKLFDSDLTQPEKSITDTIRSLRNRNQAA